MLLTVFSLVGCVCDEDSDKVLGDLIYIKKLDYSLSISMRDWSPW